MPEQDLQFTVGGSEVLDAIREGEVKPLDDLHSIESVLFIIRDLNKEIDSYRDLKRKRAKSIDVAIEKVDGKVEFLKKLIAATLQENKEKKIRFPGVGLVSARKSKKSFKVVDEQKLFKVLKDEGEFDNIVEETQGLSVKKHELNKLLNMWSGIDKIPSCVEEIKPENSVSIRFGEDIDEKAEISEEIAEEIEKLDFTS